MTIFQCSLNGEKLYLPELQETIEQSPFDDVQTFNGCYPNEDAFYGKNTEGRDVKVCEIDELLAIKVPE